MGVGVGGSGLNAECWSSGADTEGWGWGEVVRMRSAGLAELIQRGGGGGGGKWFECGVLV